MSRPPLPIDDHLPAAIEALRRRRALVLSAPPGAGKTTRLPAAIVRAGLLAGPNPALVLLQPRRVAARAVAARIAEENGWALGEEVGYHIRFERRLGPRTRLRVLTEGILTRQLLADPFLEGVGAVVLDEFHERSLHTDLALALLREVRASVREDLRLVVMSATLDAAPIARFLDDAPALEVPGRTFPVAIRHAGSDLRTPLPERVEGALRPLLAAPTAAAHRDVLVFLPGAEEIRRSARQLAPLASAEGLEVLPLHGSLPAEEQDRALRPSTRRKVILSTNVAETSLTIEGVGAVIDSGLARAAQYDPARGLDRLVLGRISRASAAQRAGRAGRTGPGTCVRLWSERDERGMAPFDEPEVRRVDLAPTVLALRRWGHADPARFGWFEPPPAAAIDGAERLLAALGALDGEGGRITAIGERLLDLPVHPRLGRLLLAAAGAGRLDEGAALAALLSEKDIVAPQAFLDGGPRREAAVHGRSDLLNRLDLLAEAERARFGGSLRGRGIDPQAARRVAQVRDDLRRIGRRLGAGPGAGDRGDDDELLRFVLLAYPDRVARRRAPGSDAGVMVGGRGVRLDRESTVREAEFFLALDPREDRRGGALEARVRIASAIRPEWLDQEFPGAVRRERTVRFDADRGRAVALNRAVYRDLVLKEDTHGAVAPEEASAALAEALGRDAEAFVMADESAAKFLGRVAFLRRWLPEAGWPEFGPEALADAIAHACAGRRTVDEARRVPLEPILRGRLSYDQQRRLDAEAPEALSVPSGSRIRLRYEPDAAPVLAVRLQELFGWPESPRLAGGRVPVLLHLLGPNFRPVQVTDDLRSFWATTYHQVRKDLRARYPRHAWPDDPLTARPEAKGGRKSP